MKRELYVAPVAELVEVSMECGVLAGSGNNTIPTLKDGDITIEDDDWF